MHEVEQWAGIDVCKRWLDVHLRPADKSFRVSNDVEGINEILLLPSWGNRPSVLAPLPAWDAVYTQVLKRFKIFALAPLAPQFWGEIVPGFVDLPPELGGRGG